MRNRLIIRRWGICGHVFIIALFIASISFSACGGGGGGGGGDDPKPNPDVDPSKTPQYMLDVVVEGEGTINVNNSPYTETKFFNQGTVLTIEAVNSDPKFKFNRWEGMVDSPDSKITITLDQNIAIKAVYERSNVSLSVDYGCYVLSGTQYILNKEGGTVSVNPQNPSDYTAKTPITLTANPAGGYVFDHWEGDYEFTSTKYPSNDSHGRINKFDINEDRHVTAIFVKSNDASLTRGEEESVLYAAYAGIGFEEFTGEYKTAWLYQAMSDDVKNFVTLVSSDALEAMIQSIISGHDEEELATLLPKSPVYQKIDAMKKGKPVTFKVTLADGKTKVDIMITPSGRIGDDWNSRTKIFIKTNIYLTKTGYQPKDPYGELLGPKYSGVEDKYNSDITLEGTGYGFFNLVKMLMDPISSIGIMFDTATIKVGREVIASYDNNEVRFNKLVISMSAKNNENIGLNYYIQPSALGGFGIPPENIPENDQRFYTLKGAFMLDKQPFFFDMLYGKYDPDAKNHKDMFIGMMGRLSVPGLKGFSVEVSNPAASKAVKDIYNGKKISDMKSGDFGDDVIKMKYFYDDESKNWQRDGTWRGGYLVFNDSKTLIKAEFYESGQVHINNIQPDRQNWQLDYAMSHWK
jgi:hypothetical protein